MAETTGQIETVGQFIELISDTQIKEGKKWVESFTLGIPATFCKFAITEESVAEIAFGISIQASRDIRALLARGEYRQLQEKAHQFLQEIHRKAASIGIVVDFCKIDCIPTLC